MTGSRKIIPIVADSTVDNAKSANEEIRGCAELEPYALRVVGDSMAPEFLEGHVIILDPGLPATHGAYVVMEVDREVVFGQFQKEDGRTFLKPLNESYPTIPVTDRSRVLGVVTQRAGRRRSERKHYD